MKIAFFVQDSGRLYGAERATLDLAVGLHQEGVDVVLWLIEEIRLGPSRGALKEAAESAGLATAEFPVGGSFSVDLIRTLRAQHATDRPDVVHTIGPKATVHAAWALHGRVPLVSTVHGWLFRPDPKERLHEWLERRAFRRFDRVITLSRHYEQALARFLGSGRVVRIPSGFRIPACPDHAPGPGPITFGMLGRLSWEKNHELFFRAVNKFVEQGGEARFLVAGEGRERKRLERLRSRRGLADRVEMTGYVPSADFFDRVSVLVQCSRMENLPYSILEAMARQRPVLAARAGGMPDLVEDGVTGFLVTPDDEADLADRMGRLAADRDLAARMGRAGRTKLEREFAPDRCIRQHLAVYRALTARPLKPES